MVVLIMVSMRIRWSVNIDCLILLGIATDGITAVLRITVQ